MLDWRRRSEFRRLSDYIAVPALVIWGMYVAISMEFRFNSVFVSGPLAILIGIGLIAAAGVLLLVFNWRDKYYFDKYDRDSR